ncbi:hypothetical protein [Chlorobium limicola]|uniref:hypothetical protein n=1 Tax=Chlorobium limicola TaxID=1092 RepID=UPI00137B3913|nr:hypothetical protein [Chlorobium limicola]
MGRKRSIASREKNFSFFNSSLRAASRPILQQSEASYTPRCDSEHTPVRPANDTPHLPPSSHPAHRQLPTAHNLPAHNPLPLPPLPATDYRLPAHRPPPTAHDPQSPPATGYRLPVPSLLDPGLST